MNARHQRRRFSRGLFSARTLDIGQRGARRGIDAEREKQNIDRHGRRDRASARLRLENKGPQETARSRPERLPRVNAIHLQGTIPELPTPSRKREGVLVYGSGVWDAPGRGRDDARKVPSGRGFPPLGRKPGPTAALSVLKPNLGVRRQPPRLLSPHRRQPSRTLALSG